MIPLELIRIEQLSDNTFSFWFKPGQQLTYTPGQFIELHIPHVADDRGAHRWFTLSSSPTEELISITTRKLPNMSTYKQQLFSTKPGEKLLASQAMGDFVLPMQRSIPSIFLVRGIGVTPLRSIAKYLRDSNSPTRSITVIHSARAEDDLLFQQVYTPISEMVIQQITPTSESASQALSGTLDLHKKQPHARIYISGPEQFTEQVVEMLTRSGISPNLLITDYFHGYLEEN